MIIIQCDACWASIPESDADSVTTFHLDTPVRATSIHLCRKCVKTKKTLYIDNPCYVEVPDAEEERKVSQGS